eukprot:TRINITY_DN8101_c0_g1_i2.p1 TRINITY_DN8101_c0_g1~~TRINITY_DN8101_c0_g1_i2.p1  ORF type:complete len:214 (-),score=55.72 TRINITY_DN8101_c0_g1_i2:38-679(-)
MRRIFGTQKKNNVPAVTLEDSAKSIEGRIDSLDAKIKKLETEVIQHREQMKKFKNGSPAQNAIKQKALRALKQKKMYEGQRDQLMAQSFNLEQTIFTTQSLKDTATQVQVIRDANKTLKSQFKEMDIDNIYDMQDEMQDLLDQNNEIQEVMSRSYEMPYDVDEADLEDELNSLEQELDVEEDLPSYLRELPSTTSNLPQIAKADQTAQQEQQF